MDSTSEELEELTTSYEPDLIVPEIVLFASLLLVAPAHFILGSNHSVESRREHFWRVSQPFCENAQASIAEQVRRLGAYFVEDSLPDVCGSCFRFFGFCSGGRVHLYCANCYYDQNYIKRYVWEREAELSRICWGEGNKVSILSQLIYKYHSPEGDRTWKLKLPRILI